MILTRSRLYGCSALLVGVLAGCASENNGSQTTPTQTTSGAGASAVAGSSPSAGAAPAASAGTPAAVGGRPAAVGGSPAAVGGGPAQAGASAGSSGTAAAAGASAGSSASSACGPDAGDGDRDGTPDCMDMCATDPQKIEPGTCGCGKPEMPACTPDTIVPTPVDPEACKVAPIPADVRSEYKLSDFYTRYASAEGTPIVATDNPVDESIRRACLVVLDLSRAQPMSRQQMRTDHIYFIMMAKNEKTVQTPEYRSRGDLDARARGFGNNPGLCAEENVMCDRTTDRWRGESICVHEYSHVMHLYVWNRVVPMFNSKVTAAYNNAVRTMRKYPNTYAASNATEYFAEGVQNWYNTNLQSSRGEAGDGVHNHINTRVEMKEYDPMLYDLLATVLPDVPQYKDCYYYE